MLDKKAYARDVLKPLNSDAAVNDQIDAALRGVNGAASGSGLNDPSLQKALTQTDLVSLFALRPGLTDQEVAQHLHHLGMFLNGARIPIAQRLGQLLRALQDKLPAEVVTARFWDSLSAAAEQARKAQLDNFAALTQRQHPLGVITTQELRVVAKAAGLGQDVSDRMLADAVRAQGLAVAEDFEAPSISVSAAPLQKELHAGFRHVLDVILLHEKAPASNFKVIDELSANIGGTQRRVSLGDVAAAKSHADTIPGDQMERGKKTLLAIGTVVSTEAELHQLILAWFLHRAQERIRKHGVMPVQVAQQFVENGLDELDARRLVAKADSIASSGPDLNSVKDQIAQGYLASARRLFLSFLDGQEGTERSALLSSIEAALIQAEQQRDAAFEEYRNAFASEDYARAAIAISRARALDCEDEELIRLQRQVPPAAPADVRASFIPESGQARVEWRSLDDPDVEFTVVRSTLGPPTNPQAGEQLSPPGTLLSVTDPSPPIARPVTYAVFARRAGGSYSKPATAEVTFLPPPREVKASASTDSVTLSWRIPREATGVAAQLVHPDGNSRRYPIESGRQLTITDLRLGNRYRVHLTAVYFVHGAKRESVPVEVDAIPRGSISTVRDLQVRSVLLPNHQSALELQWTDVPGYPVDIWSLPVEAVLRPGSTTTEGKLRQLGGKCLAGNQSRDAQRVTMHCLPLSDVQLLVPITWDGDNGLVGDQVPAGSAPAPRDLQAERFHDELRVSWKWPHGDYQILVEWRGDDGNVGSRTVDRLRYREAGGFRIPDAARVTEVKATTVATGGGKGFLGASVAVALEPAARKLHYQLTLPRGLLSGRSASLEVSSSDFHGSVTLLAVLQPGAFMPSHASDGQIIARLTLDFADTPVQRASFQVPKIKGPHWVRIFSADSHVVLIDPPTSSLKG